jgi:hypothetical protein
MTPPFSYISIIPLWRGPSPKDGFCWVWLNLAQWFWRRRFLNDPIPFLHFGDYLPFEEDLALYLNKCEFPLPKNSLYQVWLTLASWFWRRKFKKKIQCIFTLSLLSPLGEELSPSFEQTWIPFYPRMICAKSGKIGPVVLEKKSKM